LFFLFFFPFPPWGGQKKIDSQPDPTKRAFNPDWHHGTGRTDGTTVPAGRDLAGLSPTVFTLRSMSNTTQFVFSKKSVINKECKLTILQAHYP
jgi:hypothetical protein